MGKFELNQSYNKQNSFLDTTEGKKNKRSIRTDLALEACEFALENSLPGIRNDEQEEKSRFKNLLGIEVEERKMGEISISIVKVLNEEGVEVTGKPIGEYITIEMNSLSNELDDSEIQVINEEIIKSFRRFLGDKCETILVIGLGNWNVTPDALGPRVVNKLNVSRHIKGMLSETEKQKAKNVCALSPGVLGITGIETLEIVKGVVEHVKPDLVIAIDALASRSLNRICTTLQISNTGITPGSGVGNRRMELSEETLGVPVVAVGIPTVVDAATMAYDVIDSIMKMFDGKDDQNRKDRILHDFMNMPERLMVTPKEIDEIIDETAALVSHSLNIALGIDTIYN